MSDHEWQEGDKALHVTRGVVVEVVKVVGPGCVIVDCEEASGSVLKIGKGKRPTTAEGSVTRKRFATSVKRLRLI